MDNSNKRFSEHISNLPSPKWLVIAAIALALWAAALGAWWSSLRVAPTTARRTPLAQPTITVQVTPQPSVTAQPAAEGTPVVLPVVRSGDQFVRQEDWLALARAFDTDRALADIAELASAKYSGRAVGSPGSKLASEWIAARFAEYGLQPAGDSRTYFQDFPVPYAELTAMPSLQIIDDRRETIQEYRFRLDYTIWLGGYADGGRAEGPVIWASDGKHDDYDGLNAEGAVVLCRYKLPLDDTLRQALEHGAKAVLLAQLEGANFRMRRTARTNALLPQGIPTLLVSKEVAEDLLAGSGLTLDDLTIEYRARPLATRVRINVPLQYEKQAVGRNVLGVLPGSDPDGVNQVFVIGAHYDHLGADPDGTVWVGANDDASGVAVLLEIARQWQEHGYVPKRTVLFAAWDGEEIGLYGSKYYVEHPPYPLTDTVGMLQLDMVGAATPKLAIDQGGLVADQSLVSAAELGTPIQMQSLGRSDHAPFVGAGVPATLYIWWDGDDPGVIYHIPEDDLKNIEPTKLQAAGELAHLVALNMSWNHEQLEDLAMLREQIIAARDVKALSSIVDPQDVHLLRQEEDWLKGLILRQPTEFTMTASSAIVASDVATSTLTIGWRWQPDDNTTIASLPVRWMQRGLGWYYGGPAWDHVTGEHIRLLHLQQPALAQTLLQQAETLYEFLTDEVGLAIPEGITVRFYGSSGEGNHLAWSPAASRNLLQALHTPPPGYEQASGWPVGDGIVLSQDIDLPIVLTEFALQQTGWPARTASWMAQGLVDYQPDRDKQVARGIESAYMPLLLQADENKALWNVEGMPDRHEVAKEKSALWRAQAWAMTQYLLQRDGWTALQHPTTLQVEAWRSAWLEPWHLAAKGIQETLEQRAKAVLARDRAAFLATVDPGNPVLVQEETHWFEDLAKHPAKELTYENKLLSLDNDQAIVKLTVQYKLAESDSAPQTVSYQGRFVRKGPRWLYTDVAFTEQHGEHFVLKYQSPDQGLYANKLLAEAEQAYAQIASDLDFQPAEPLEIKAYDENNLFCFSIFLSMPRARGWTEPGESIKLGIEDWRQTSYEGVGRIIAHELTHTALFAKGVRHGAVHEGTGQYEASRYDPQWMNLQIRRWRQQVYDLVRSKRPLTLVALDNWREVAKEDVELLYTMGWDIVTYFRRRYGREAFLQWLQLLGTDASFEEAFLKATGTAFADFDATWRESVLQGHIDRQYIATALSFDGEHALQHVQALAQPAWAGREAGTPGNDAAAHYIADRFAEYGLQPAGDQGTYFQSFAISQTVLSTTPLLTLQGQDGQGRSFAYRVDFREWIGGYAGSGEVESSIVYVKDHQGDDLRFGGRVLLTQSSENAWQDAQEAQAHGAAALLLITSKWTKHMAVKALDTPLLQAASIPVYELTREAVEALFGLAGYQHWQVDKLPPILLLPLSARMEVQLVSTPTVSVANVLGVLPGSDPQVSDQVLILGAHYDHVGTLPNGTVYPGANNDASGVAALLEIARIWQKSGYRPRRTVLFAAWNAAEMGFQGSEHYAMNPTYPLELASAMLQLDMVGQGAGYYIMASADELQDARILAHLDNAARQVEGRLTYNKYEGGSDHDTFHTRGIPAIMLSWERPEYVHTPEDAVQTIDAKKLQATGRVSALALMTMADE